MTPERLRELIQAGESQEANRLLHRLFKMAEITRHGKGKRTWYGRYTNI